MKLFEPVVADDRLHPNFRAVIAPGFAEREQAVLADWANGFVDRDGKFVTEFQTTFNSSFWELYLHAAFRELGFTCDFSHPAPDFLLQSPEQRICAEAVIAGHAEGYKPEWYKSREDFETFDRDAVLHLATIRLANAIWAKHCKYLESYSKLPHVEGLPFVICVAPFEQPLFFVQNDHALRRVLYGFDQPLWLPGEDGQERLVVGEAVMNDVKKDSGATIPLGFFTRPDMAEVSAVIFSNTATFGKLRALAKTGPFPVTMMAVRYNEHGTEPHMISTARESYEESLLDGLHICLNPFATHPLDAKRFDTGETTGHWYDSDEKQYYVESPDGFLIQRGCVSFTAEGKYSHLAAVPTETYKAVEFEPWAEGELHFVGGTVSVFTDNHLAHFRGWTICVARDTIDNDWAAQAVLGSHRTLADFHGADKRGDYLLPENWHETKELALEELKGQILAHVEGKNAKPAD
ncbi:MAG: hypothetical protein KF688_18070 [Pirellulales bacterium]|nr:hypothetical protein [Pirellulales bacterium]